MEIQRKKILAQINKAFRVTPAVGLLGPRQCGKTTLAHQYSKKSSEKIHFFDLENPNHLSRLENPMTTLSSLEGLVIIDEIQRSPDLFPVLRVLIDKNPKTKYLILGSASQTLLKQSSETLAGRITYIEMSGFSSDEINNKKSDFLWIRGGFPKSFLAKNDTVSYSWRQGFIKTFLETDIPNLGIQVSEAILRRFWTMLAHYHGQIFNASEIGKSLSVSYHTSRHYLDILCSTFLIRQLQPWYYNTKKRLVKRPKIYFRDTGILHTLLSLENKKQVLNHPKMGASWEGFALEQVINFLNLRQEDCFFWSLHTGAELDLVFQRKGKLWGIEVKFSDAPSKTPSMKSALSELSLSHLWVIYPGKETYALDKKISVVSIDNLKSLTL